MTTLKAPRPNARHATQNNTMNTSSPSAVDNRLLELLEAKDRELEDVTEELREAQRALEYGVEWMLHRKAEVTEVELPVPRVELLLVDNREHSRQWEYSLVHKTRGGNSMRVPLGGSTTHGGNYAELSFPENLDTPENVREFDILLPGLLNDMCFFAEQSKLPAIITIEGMHVQVTALRPRLEYKLL